MGNGNLTVLGGGAWGTALASHGRRCGLQVKQWVREPEIAHSIAYQQKNDLFLNAIELEPGIQSSTSLKEAISGADWIIAAVPCAFSRSVYRQLDPTWFSGALWIAATKGIEPDSGLFPTDVLREELGVEAVALSGPTFAKEVASGLPSAVVLAGPMNETASFQAVFSNEQFRVYTNEDVLGVQIMGAMKNVLAIAAGMIEGLGMGANAMAAVITRGLAEMTRLGIAMGAQADTFRGLAGVGDLVLTCTGSLSRNRTVGMRIGKGESLQQILESTQTVAEGVRTTIAAVQLAKKLDIDLPITQEVYEILHHGADPKASLTKLMLRPLTSEIEKSSP